MTDSASKSISDKNVAEDQTNVSPPENTEPQASYVKLAMRNMVRKGRQSLWHFFLTTVGLVGLLIGLAYLTKP